MAVVVEPLMLIGKCRVAGLLESHHMVVRPSEGLSKCTICVIIA
jgi:hypothetical protein